jgi:teichuronic acid exporter
MITEIIRKGIFWSFFQQFSNQLISFSISLLLARLLLPKDFGIIGMVYVVFSIGNVLIEAGLSQSLIRDANTSSKDYSTVFYSNLIIAFLLYGIVFIYAPSIAQFYNQPVLVNVIRVYGITFIVSGFSSVQNALLIKQLKFKVIMLLSLPSNIAGGIVGIVLAYNGFGVWSLVFTTLVTVLVSTFSLWIFSDWKPSWIFDFEAFKKHFFFGYKLTLTNLLNAGFVNVYQVILGKLYSPKIVGFYTRADSMRNITVYSVINTVNRVTFPVFAKLHEDTEEFSRVYKNIVNKIFLVVTPIYMYLYIEAFPLFEFLFTKKWVFAVDYFQILLIASVLFSINGYNANVVSSIGRSDLVLKIEVIKIIISAFAIIVFFQFGIMALLWSQVFLSVIDYLINYFYLRKLFVYPLESQLKNIFAVLLITLLTGFILKVVDVYLFSQFMNIVRLMLSFIQFFITYLCFLLIFKMVNFKELFFFLKK